MKLSRQSSARTTPISRGFAVASPTTLSTQYTTKHSSGLTRRTTALQATSTSSFSTSSLTSLGSRYQSLGASRTQRTRATNTRQVQPNTAPSTMPMASFATSSQPPKPTKSIFNLLKSKSFQTLEANDPSLEPLGATVNLNQSNERWEMVYDGVVGNSLEYLKKMSIGSLALSVVSFPIIIAFETESVSPHGRVLLALTTLFFGAGTTALTNAVCNPYVIKGFLSKDNPNIIELTTIGLTGKKEAFRFNVNEPTTTRVNKPLTTFQHISTGRYFYLNEDMATHPVFGMILPHLFEVKHTDDDNSSSTQKH